MRIGLHTWVGIVLLGGACSSPDPSSVPPARSELATQDGFSFEGQPLDASQIALTLSRTECYGTCPIYTVTLHGDGRVDWEGRKYVTEIGERHGRVEPQVVRILLRRAEELHVFDLPDEYTEPVADIPDTVHGFQIAGRMKSVRVHSNGWHRWMDGSEVPDWRIKHELKAMADVFDALVETGQWIYPGQSGDPDSREEGTDVLDGFRVELTSEALNRASAFKVSIDGDGRLHWQGERHVLVVGDRDDHVDRRDVELLARRLSKSKCLDEPMPASEQDDAWPFRLNIALHGRRISRSGAIAWHREGDQFVPNSPGYVAVISLVEAIARVDRFVGTDDECGTAYWQ